jgi:hypothetical protein
MARVSALPSPQPLTLFENRRNFMLAIFEKGRTQCAEAMAGFFC